MKVDQIRDTEDHITAEAVDASATTVLEAGAVVVVTRSGILSHTLPVAVTKVRAALNQDLKGLVPFQGVEPMYVALALRRFEDEILHTCTKHGTTVQSVEFPRLLQFCIPLAPMPEQRRIVAAIEELLTRLDDAVASLRRVFANLKRYRASVLKAASEGRLVPIEDELARAEGRNYEPGIELLRRILQERVSLFRAIRRAPRHDTADLRQLELAEATQPRAQVLGSDGLPDLPEGWEWSRAEQLCGFITKGTTPAASKLSSRAGEIPFIKVYNLTFKGTLDFSVGPTFIARATHERELARSRVLPGDVLMNIVGPPLGKVSIVPPSFPEWNMNQAIAVFRVMPSFDRDFMSICLRSEGILRWAVTRAKATAGQFNLTLEICRNLPLPVPPLAEQKRIAAEVARRLSLVTDLEASVEVNMKRAERLRRSILKRAFEGQLVQQDPTDGPPPTVPVRVRAERNHRTSHRNPIPTGSNLEAIFAQSALGV